MSKIIMESVAAERNGNWKGDDVGLGGLHTWIKRRLPKPARCERCNVKSNDLDLANISQQYLRRLDDWEYICRKCHVESDGRIDNLLIGMVGRKKKPCQRCGKKTIRFKYCDVCAKIIRREWWKRYNQTPDRKKYRKTYNTKHSK